MLTKVVFWRYENRYSQWDSTFYSLCIAVLVTTFTHCANCWLNVFHTLKSRPYIEVISIKGMYEKKGSLLVTL